MKFSVSSNELYNKLSIAQKIINSRTLLPITENFLFNVDGNKLTITATDVDTMSITSIMDLDNSDGNIVFAMPQKIIEILKELPEQIIELTVTQNNDNDSYNICLRNESGYTCEFLGLDVGEDAADFPVPKPLENVIKSFDIPENTLIKGISRTLFAVAEGEQVRDVMKGIFFDIEENSLSFVGTDAHMLAKYTINNIQIDGEKSNFILPKKTATILKNILSADEENNVNISFDEKKIILKLSDYVINCRRIEGTYPNYKSVILSNPNIAVIDRVSLLRAIKRVKVFANFGTGLVKFNITENSIHLTTQDIDFSTSAEDTLTCQYSGNPIEIGFKAMLFEEILSNLIGNQTSMELADASKACIFKPFEKDENEDLLMLLMPMYT